MKNLYDILGIKQDASIEEIIISYRKLALTHHPDKGGKEVNFIEIQKAYEILSDKKARANYDAGNLVEEDLKQEALHQLAELLRQTIADGNINDPLSYIKVILTNKNNEAREVLRKVRKTRRLLLYRKKQVINMQVNSNNLIESVILSLRRDNCKNYFQVKRVNRLINLANELIEGYFFKLD